MCRYTIWLSQNNIGSWESGQTYLNAIRQLAIALHQPDPVNDEEAWDVLRKRYKERITVSVKKHRKSRYSLATIRSAHTGRYSLFLTAAHRTQGTGLPTHVHRYSCRSHSSQGGLET